MPHLSSNTRRAGNGPRYLAYDNGFAWVVTDRLVPGTGVPGKPAEWEQGKRGVIVGMFITRDNAVDEARRLNEQDTVAASR